MTYKKVRAATSAKIIILTQIFLFDRYPLILYNTNSVYTINLVHIYTYTYTYTNTYTYTYTYTYT